MSGTNDRKSDELHFVVAQLRHAYTQLYNNTVVDLKQFADGLIAPCIRRLEEWLMRELRVCLGDGTSPMQPPSPDIDWVALRTRIREGFQSDFSCAHACEGHGTEE